MIYEFHQFIDVKQMNYTYYQLFLIWYAINKEIMNKTNFLNAFFMKYEAKIIIFLKRRTLLKFLWKMTMIFYIFMYHWLSPQDMSFAHNCTGWAITKLSVINFMQLSLPADVGTIYERQKVFLSAWKWQTFFWNWQETAFNLHFTRVQIMSPWNFLSFYEKSNE